jgi:hypothetical protein
MKRINPKMSLFGISSANSYGKFLLRKIWCADFYNWFVWREKYRVRSRKKRIQTDSILDKEMGKKGSDEALYLMKGGISCILGITIYTRTRSTS